jgi:hypothetical protein
MDRQEDETIGPSRGWHRGLEVPAAGRRTPTYQSLAGSYS